MATASFQDRVLEFFTLREAIRVAAVVPEETRTTANRGLRLAFQKREAAETLWPRGSTAEALKLAASAADEAATALAGFSADAPPSWLPRAQSLATEASRATDGIRPTMVESETQPSHEEAFRVAIDSLVAIEDLARNSLATTNDFQRLRAARIGVTAFVVVAGTLGLAHVLHTPAIIAATASAQYGDDNSAIKAFDGDAFTSWVLPDHVGQGWIDFQLGKPRAVRGLHILASNPPYNDRDVKEAHIEALRDGVPVKSVDVTFPEPQGKEPSWNDVALDAPKSDHLRITIKSNYRLSAGIGEIEIK